MGRADSKQEIHESPCSTAQFHVLAVDDNFVERKIIETMLKQNCFRVTTFDSAIKALEFLAQQIQRNQDVDEVNMIFTDYCMPGMTGYDFLRRVKESSELNHIPVVIMSSEDFEDRIESCISEGAEEFLVKPLKSADVERVISQVVDNSSASPQQNVSDAQPT